MVWLRIGVVAALFITTGACYVLWNKLIDAESRVEQALAQINALNEEKKFSEKAMEKQLTLEREVARAKEERTTNVEKTFGLSGPALMDELLRVLHEDSGSRGGNASEGSDDSVPGNSIRR